jgi:hypothetical protein
MSKTKEEILQQHYIADRGLVNPELYVHNAMDEYAQQQVAEFKEKLRKEIGAEIEYYESVILTDQGKGSLKGLLIL